MLNTYTAHTLFSKGDYMMNKVPSVTFRTRVRDESIEGDNPFRWQDVTSEDYFAGKRSIVFALPGAFTPTCSTFQLPNFEKLYEDFKAKGIDEIYCLSVNDAFVMYQWGLQQGVKNVKLIPDGNGEFSRKMGMLVDKANLGFGMRSWRYAMIVNDMEIEKMFVENGFCDLAQDDPYQFSSPENILEQL